MEIGHFLFVPYGPPYYCCCHYVTNLVMFTSWFDLGQLSNMFRHVLCGLAGLIWVSLLACSGLYHIQLQQDVAHWELVFQRRR